MNGQCESGSEYDSSDSGSTNSSSSSAESSSSNEARHNSTTSSGMVWEADSFGEFIKVTCANNEAKFYRSRFARGSVGRSVLFGNCWMTPNEFQSVSGRQSSKDWKRSIRTNGRCLKEYINEGMLTEHSKTCSCAVCVGEDQTLRREGELALAAKRRRLSQAEGSSRTIPVGAGDKGVKKHNGQDKRVWSPSGGESVKNFTMYEP